MKPVSVSGGMTTILTLTAILILRLSNLIEGSLAGECLHR
jgi:hypothetical protein